MLDKVRHGLRVREGGDVGIDAEVGRRGGGREGERVPV